MESINPKPELASRRQFIQRSAVLGTGLLLAESPQLFARSNAPTSIASKGFAARDKSAHLSPWSFERRAVGDTDILIDIKFCGICHSAIHQLRGDWGNQTYPQVPGHEIAGIVAAVGKNVTKFKVGDQAGVGCMVDSCGTCTSCQQGEEQYCDNHATLFTYGNPEKSSPTGITQGGYATNIVVKEHFDIKIPQTITLQDAAPLLCAGITTYAPMVKNSLKPGDKIGVAGIGGLGHLAIKLARAQGAEVYAFTSSPAKIKDIQGFGAKEVIVVDTVEKLKPYNGTLDYIISTIPVNYDIASYASLVKPNGTYTQVGMPAKGAITINTFAFNTNRVNLQTSLIGGIPQTQKIMDFCAAHKIYPQTQLIGAKDINAAWKKVIDKEARYRYVIDTATI